MTSRGLRFRSGWTLERRAAQPAAAPAPDVLWSPEPSAPPAAAPAVAVPLDIGELVQWAAIAALAVIVLGRRHA